jgi:dCTP deaminase
MILTGSEIARQRELGQIVLDPFDPARINPNSYDFALGSQLKMYADTVLDVRRENRAVTVDIPADGYLLRPDRIYLGHTEEVIGSTGFVPIIRGRSGIARLGLFVHVTADLIDIGSISQLTLQLHAVQPVRVYPGLVIGQVTFWTVLGDIDPYQGRYQSTRGPQESLIHLDFE